MPSKTLEDLKTEETNAIHTTEALKPSIKQKINSIRTLKMVYIKKKKS